jgi:molecular chaperone DnaK (HSP70)
MLKQNMPCSSRPRSPELHYYLLLPGEDKKRREAVDTKNQAESMVYQTEKQLKEFEEKLPADIKVLSQGLHLILSWSGFEVENKL